MTDKETLEKEFSELAGKIERLQEAEKKLNALDIPEKHSSRAASIKSKLRDPDRVAEVERELEELKEVLTRVETPPAPPQAPQPTPVPPQPPSGITPRRMITPAVPELAEIYEEASVIGSGGFARVFCARRKSDGAMVAVKVPISLDAATGKSFIREITSWNTLSHRNIVKLYDMNVMPVPYFEMELCDGNLDGLDKPLDVDDALHYIYEISTGLKHAHNKGIIHRDLKPHNILLKDGVPKISDWGLSKIASSSRTSTTSSFTPVYAAPEQLSTGTRVDERTDIYQLGVILYELVTGRLPFMGETLPQLITQILTEEPQKPSQFNPDADHIDAIVLKCLSKDVEQRYRNVDELQKELAKPMKIEYQESLVQSRGDIRRTNFLSGELCILCLRSGDIAGALKYGSSLQHYATGEIQEKLSKFISGLEYRQKEGMDVPEDIIEEAVILVHMVRMGR